MPDPAPGAPSTTATKPQPVWEPLLPSGAQLLKSTAAFVGDHSRMPLVVATTHPEQTITPPEDSDAR